MRKSQRRQNPPVYGRAHRYGAALNESKNDRDDETVVDVSHLEWALETGLEAVVRPGLTED
jgi:hypothetical protein